MVLLFVFASKLYFSCFLLLVYIGVYLSEEYFSNFLRFIFGSHKFRKQMTAKDQGSCLAFPILLSLTEYTVENITLATFYMHLISQVLNQVTCIWSGINALQTISLICGANHKISTLLFLNFNIGMFYNNSWNMHWSMEFFFKIKLIWHTDDGIGREIPHFWRCLFLCFYRETPHQQHQSSSQSSLSGHTRSLSHSPTSPAPAFCRR